MGQRPSLDRKNATDRQLVFGIRPQAVDGLGGKCDQASPAEDYCCALNLRTGHWDVEVFLVKVLDITLDSRK